MASPCQILRTLMTSAKAGQTAITMRPDYHADLIDSGWLYASMQGKLNQVRSKGELPSRICPQTSREARRVASKPFLANCNRR